MKTVKSGNLCLAYDFFDNFEKRIRIKKGITTERSASLTIH